MLPAPFDDNPEHALASKRLKRNWVRNIVWQEVLESDDRRPNPRPVPQDQPDEVRGIDMPFASLADEDVGFVDTVEETAEVAPADDTAFDSLLLPTEEAEPSKDSVPKVVQVPNKQPVPKPAILPKQRVPVQQPVPEQPKLPKQKVPEPQPVPEQPRLPRQRIPERQWELNPQNPPRPYHLADHNLQMAFSGQLPYVGEQLPRPTRLHDVVGDGNCFYRC